MVNRATEEFNRVVPAREDMYVKTNLGIKRTDEETQNIMSNTFGFIKRNILDVFWNSIGLDQNVNSAYYQAMTDPNSSFEVQGKRYYPHPGVGNLRAYNEFGNPSGGCFTMQTMG